MLFVTCAGGFPLCVTPLTVFLFVCSFKSQNLAPKHMYRHRNAQLARPNAGMKTASSISNMRCMHLEPPASHVRQLRANHSHSVGVWSVKTSKLSQRSHSHSKRARISSIQTRASADVFALDFDGVLVDSEPEV